MINRLHGILIEKQAPLLVLNVNGIGYEILAPMTTFYKLPDLNKEITLYTQLIVREDSQTLYGFINQEEKKLFQLLIKANGVGPKLALTILSGIAPEVFVQSVIDNDVSTLIKLPGIGRKTAERLIVDLRDSLKEWRDEHVSMSGFIQNSSSNAVKDAISALIALGYKPQDAQNAVNAYKDDSSLTSEGLIRLALKRFTAKPETKNHE
jgi:holliday junction DNA helicase RuvA